MRRIAIYCPIRLTEPVCHIITAEHSGWTRVLAIGSWEGQEEGVDYIWSYGESVGIILHRVKEEMYYAGEKAIAYEIDEQFFLEDLANFGKSAKLDSEVKNV